MTKSVASAFGAVVLAATVALSFASPAEAGPVPQGGVPSPYVAADPSGDEVCGSDDPCSADGRADILGIRVTHGEKIKLDVELSTFTDPATNKHWSKGFTFLDWEISTDGDEEGEYFARLQTSNSGNVASFVDRNSSPNPPRVCEAAFKRQNGNWYRLSFARSCINNPETIRVVAVVLFDNKPYHRAFRREDRSDAAPDSAATLNFTPEIAFG